jgi:Winged helix-turn helix
MGPDRDSHALDGLRVWRRRGDITFTVSAGDYRRLHAIAANPKSPQKHVWRARIVLLSGEGQGISAIMAATAKSKTCVWHWQERFMHEGVDGVLRDRSRPSGKTPVPPERIAEKQLPVLATPAGIEPATNSLEGYCSIR